MPYSSSVVIANKESEKLRFCVYYRCLNEAIGQQTSINTDYQGYSSDFSDAQIYSVLDLKCGYWQITMVEKFKALTTFSIFDFEVMSFGLHNAPATFQRFMLQKVFVDQLRKFYKMFIDDIIVYSKTYKQHIL